MNEGKIKGYSFEKVHVKHTRGIGASKMYDFNIPASQHSLCWTCTMLRVCLWTHRYFAYLVFDRVRFVVSASVRERDTVPLWVCVRETDLLLAGYFPFTDASRNFSSSVSLFSWPRVRDVICMNFKRYDAYSCNFHSTAFLACKNLIKLEGFNHPVRLLFFFTGLCWSCSCYTANPSCTARLCSRLGFISYFIHSVLNYGQLHQSGFTARIIKVSSNLIWAQ